jgi:hypothetical protein
VRLCQPGPQTQKSVSSRSLYVVRVSLRSKQVQTHNPRQHGMLMWHSSPSSSTCAPPKGRRPTRLHRGRSWGSCRAGVCPSGDCLPTTQTHAQTSRRRPRSSRRASTSPTLVAASPAPSEAVPRRWPWRSCLAGNFFMNEFRPGSCSTSVASSNNGSSWSG